MKNGSSFNSNNSHFDNETVNWFYYFQSTDSIKLTLKLEYRTENGEKSNKKIKLKMIKSDKQKPFDHQLGMRYDKNIKLTREDLKNCHMNKSFTDQFVISFNYPFILSMNFFLKQKSKRTKIKLNPIQIIIKSNLTYEHQMEIMIRDTKEIQFNETKFIEFFSKVLKNPIVIMNGTGEKIADQMKIAIASPVEFSNKTMAFINCFSHNNQSINETKNSIIDTFGERFYTLFSSRDCPIFLHNIQNIPNIQPTDSFQNVTTLFFTINHGAIQSLSSFLILVMVILQLVLSSTDKSISI